MYGNLYGRHCQKHPRPVKNFSNVDAIPCVIPTCTCAKETVNAPRQTWNAHPIANVVVTASVPKSKKISVVW